MNKRPSIGEKVGAVADHISSRCRVVLGALVCAACCLCPVAALVLMPADDDVSPGAAQSLGGCTACLFDDWPLQW